MPYKDAQKEKEYKILWNKRHYKENRELEKKRIFGRRDRIVVWMREYKSKLSCEICGENTPACLDFHHRDGRTKDISIAMFRQKGWGIDHIKSEMAKCIVICANCHRKVHAGLISL